MIDNVGEEEDNWNGGMTCHDLTLTCRSDNDAEEDGVDGE